MHVCLGGLGRGTGKMCGVGQHRDVSRHQVDSRSVYLPVARPFSSKLCLQICKWGQQSSAYLRLLCQRSHSECLRIAKGCRGSLAHQGSLRSQGQSARPQGTASPPVAIRHSPGALAAAHTHSITLLMPRSLLSMPSTAAQPGPEMDRGARKTVPSWWC